VSNICFIILYSYKAQLITESDLKNFIKIAPKNLQDVIPENLLEGIVFEHNLNSLSRIYENIGFDILTKFLKLSIDKILNYAFKMILQSKISAKIDEINEVIYFETTGNNN